MRNTRSRRKPAVALRGPQRGRPPWRRRPPRSYSPVRPRTRVVVPAGSLEVERAASLTALLRHPAIDLVAEGVLARSPGARSRSARRGWGRGGRWPAESAARVSCERSWTVSWPIRPPPQRASWARRIGPKVSQSSNQAAGSRDRRRPTKLVVRSLGTGRQGLRGGRGQARGRGGRAPYLTTFRGDYSRNRGNRGRSCESARGGFPTRFRTPPAVRAKRQAPPRRRGPKDAQRSEDSCADSSERSFASAPSPPGFWA